MKKVFACYIDRCFCLSSIHDGSKHNFQSGLIILQGAIIDNENNRYVIVLF
jgi:hypothetical protein